MLFLHADFWPLFWGVVGGGAGLTGLLSLFAADVSQNHRRPVPVAAEVAPRRHGRHGRHDEAAAPARAA